MFIRKDFYFSVITGLITGLITWRIFEFLNVQIGLFGRKLCWSEGGSLGDVAISCWGISWAWLVMVIPVLWILGVNLGYFLGRWLNFFNQFGKFAAVGFTNAAVYFGILNILIAWSDINKGFWYSVFVAVAFIIGTTHSYFWNKYWVFSAISEGVNKEEFGKFLTVSVVAGLINVGTASGIVNFITPMFGLTADQWANIGGVAGSAVALVFSFVGFKLLVFGKAHKPISP
ncbi:MAG: GtrA family protein [Patescibacteria group bacterium]